MNRTHSFLAKLSLLFAAMCMLRLTSYFSGIVYHKYMHLYMIVPNYIFRAVIYINMYENNCDSFAKQLKKTTLKDFKRFHLKFPVN